MNSSGWLLVAAMCVAAFLPAAGARTAAGRRWLLVLGVVAALGIGSLAVAATQPSEGFFPPAAAYGFLFLGIPIGAGVATAGVVLVLTRSRGVSDGLRTVLATIGFVGAPAALIWRLLT